jgi:hypothetical protein
VNVAYFAQLQAQDGVPPYSWSVVSGVLPGVQPNHLLHLSQTTGAITGTTTAVETRTFEIQVTDSDSPASSDTQVFTLAIGT